MYHVINNVLMGLNRVGGVFYDYAASVFIQSALLVILLFAIDLLLRKRVRAVFRYCVWLLVLVKLILPPMLSLPTGIGYWIGDHIPAAPGVSNMAFDAVALEHAGPSGKMPQVRPAENIAGHDPAMARLHSALIPLTWQAVVFLLWLAGVLAFLAVLVQRIRFVKGLVAASCPAGDELTGLLEQCRRQMAVRREIKLRLSEAVPSPAVCGLLKPTVLMPTSLVEKLSPEGLRATLIHELAHIKRGDLWVNSIQTFLQVVYFYNPFVWFANSIIRKVCEEAVDETVLVALGGQAKDYSNTLIDIGEMVFWKADLGLRLIGVAESKKALQWRIKHMLNRPIPKSSKLGALGIAMLVVAAAVLLPMAKAEKTVEDNKPVVTENERKPTKSLHQAATDGDVEQIRLLISSGADVNARDEKNNTALHHAADHGHTHVAEFLLAKGADINANDNDGGTPLHSAALGGHRDVTELLVARGADVNAKKKAGREKGATPLFYACTREVAELLIAKGADLDARSGRNRWTALHRAIRSVHKDVAELLIAKGADVSAKANHGLTPLDSAAWNGSKDIVELLIVQGAKVYPIHSAAYIGDLAKVKAVIEGGADINAKDKHGLAPLHYAATREMAELLVARGADVDTEDRRQSRRPLHWAAVFGHRDVAEFLIAKGADVKAKDRLGLGNTPLLLAAQHGHKDLAEILISNGADVNIKYSNPEGLAGATPLHWAAIQGHESVARLLIAKGADVKTGNPLLWAVLLSQKPVAELLIAKGANVNATLPNGRTVLHCAMKKDLAELLVANGADLNAKDNEGRTALSLARDGGHKEVVELLREHGAKE